MKFQKFSIASFQLTINNYHYDGLVYFRTTGCFHCLHTCFIYISIYLRLDNG